MQCFVRTGCLGTVGWFTSAETAPLERGATVICRTARGLEVGQVLLCEAHENGSSRPVAGSIVRPLTAADDKQMWSNRGQQMQAFELAKNLLSRRQIPVTLIDTEWLFDRQAAYFYVSDDLGDQADSVSAELSSRLATAVHFQSLVAPANSTCAGCCGPEGNGQQGCGGKQCADCPAVESCRQGRSGNQHE